MGYNIGYVNSSDSTIINPPIEQGSTFELNFTVTNIFSSMGAGLQIRAQYRPDLGGIPDPDDNNAVDFTCTIVDLTDTIVTCHIEIPALTTTTMLAGRGFWDCELEGNNGYVLKPFGASQKAKVVRETTK